MAHVEKITITRYGIPLGKGRFKFVPKGTPNAKKIVKESRTYYAVLESTKGGKRHRRKINLRVTDKQAAEALLVDMLRQQDRTKAGLVNPHQKHLDSAISGQVEEYLADMKLQGRNERYVDGTKLLLDRIVTDTPLSSLADLNGDNLDRFLAGLNGDLAAATREHHRKAAHRFANWLVRKRRLPDNPLRHVTRIEGGQKQKRRALPVDQLHHLLEVAKQRPLLDFTTVRRGKNKGQQVAKIRPTVRDRLIKLGQRNYLAYRTATLTGLRRSELAALCIHQLHLDGDQPYLIVPSFFNRKQKVEVKLPLLLDLAAELSAWVQGRDVTERVFQKLPDMKALRGDLETAGIPEVDEQDRIFVFHCFRKCTASYLNKAGVSPRLAQLFMRHKDVRLTLQVYDDAALHDLRQAAQALHKKLAE
jgi:integrase